MHCSIIVTLRLLGTLLLLGGVISIALPLEAAMRLMIERPGGGESVGWMLAVLLPAIGLIGGAWLLHIADRLRTNWYRPGQCRHCGYDLRAHPRGANCPECGTTQRS